MLNGTCGGVVRLNVPLDTPETTLEECVVSRPPALSPCSHASSQTAPRGKQRRRVCCVGRRCWHGRTPACVSVPPAGSGLSGGVWGLTRSVTRTLNAYCRKLAAEGASTLPDLISWLMCVELLPTSRTHPLLALPKKDTNCTALSDASNNWQHARSFSTHGHLSAAKRTLVHVSRSESV
jgi:hypothetical protein